MDRYTSAFDEFMLSARLDFRAGRRSLMVIRPEGLPEPLQRVADAMYDAQTDDQAKAAASEFLTLSEEWVDRA